MAHVFAAGEHPSQLSQLISSSDKKFAAAVLAGADAELTSSTRARAATRDLHRAPRRSHTRLQP